MTTRKEIETECLKEIKKTEKQVKVLEERHKKFSNEDVDEEKNETERRKLRNQMELLTEKSYEGNFGTPDNRYESKIPYDFKFNEKDRHEILEALEKIQEKKLQKITDTKEYKDLEKKEDKLCSKDLTCKEHRDIHDKLGDLDMHLSREKNIMNTVKTRGGLIKMCKSIKERERWEKIRIDREERVKIIKKMILAGKTNLKKVQK